MHPNKDETQGQRKHIEREFETGSDEFFKAGSMNMYNNMKRTYDEYQHESLESIRRNRAYVDKILSDAQTHDNNVRGVSLQALQNAVETANNTGKQAGRHADLAIDRQWNVDEQGYTAKEILRSDTFKTGIEAVLVSVLSEMKKTK